MQKLLLSISLALLCCFSAMGATYTITFKTNTSDGSTEIASNTNMDNVVSAGAGYIGGFSGCSKAYYASVNGVKLGSSKAGGELAFTIATAYQANIKRITIRSAAYGTDACTLSLAVNGSNVKSDITPGTDAVYTFTNATTVSSIDLLTSGKRAYISEIVLETEEVTTYSITIDTQTTQGGTITTDKTSAAEGETVTIIGTPSGSGYQMTYAAAYKSPSYYPFVEATIGTDNTATFTMPACNVMVYATFEASGSEASRVLDAVAISGTPAKLQYAIGETFSTDGLTVTATYLVEDTEGNITTDNQDVTAQATWTIDPATAFTAAGTQTVTVMAAFGGEDDVEEYNVTVVKKKPTLTPSALTMNMEVGDRESLECTTEPANLALTYTIADTTIAKTHEDVPSTIIAVAPGTTTCTIAFAGNDTYQASSISVTINVADTTGSGTDPEEPVETDCGDALAGTYSITPNDTLWSESCSGSDATITQVNGGQNGICMELKKNTSTSNMYINGSQTRVYSNYTMQFDVPEGFLINAIQFTADGSNWKGTHSASVGTMTDNKSWTGSSKTVTITFGGTCRITGIKVTYSIDNATDVANTQETAYTVAEALEIIDNRTTNNSAIQAVYVGGTIKSVTEISASYGNATYVIEDAAGNELTIYHGKWLGNAAFTAADSAALAAGDEVIVYGILILYQKDGQDDVYEMKSGNYVVYHNRPAATLLGDVNKDGAVDVSDISTLAEYIFGNTPAQFDADAADANKDGAIDVSDISTIAEIIFAN